MVRDAFKDDDLFISHDEWELKYVADLYSRKKEVYNFLKEKSKKGNLRNLTHLLVYELIEKELSLPIPN
jgi:hypothetical protein